MAEQLTARQGVFVQEYLVDLNATQAATRAGYSPKAAQQTASRLLGMPHIAAAVAEAMDARNRRTMISQDRILEELALIAFGDLRDVASWSAEGVVLKDSDELTPEQAVTVAEVTRTGRDGGSAKIKRHDKLKALELLMRHKGMLNDKLSLEHNVPVSMGAAECQAKAQEARETLRTLRERRRMEALEA